MFLLLSLRSDFDLAKVEATSSNLVTRSKPVFYLNFDLAEVESNGFNYILFSIESLYKIYYVW